MSDSKNKSLTTTDKLLVELNCNALLFATNGKRIYNLVVTTQTTGTIKGRVYFEYLHRKFECELNLQANQISLTALSPSLLTSSGLFKVQSTPLEGNIYINDLGIITQQGDETIGWLIIDIINHFNSLRLKPKFPNRVPIALN